MKKGEITWNLNCDGIILGNELRRFKLEKRTCHNNLVFPKLFARFPKIMLLSINQFKDWKKGKNSKFWMIFEILIVCFILKLILKRIFYLLILYFFVILSIINISNTTNFKFLYLKLFGRKVMKSMKLISKIWNFLIIKFGFEQLEIFKDTISLVCFISSALKIYFEY